MLKLIETELARARNMAEHANDGFLLYLIDMAILEVKRKARAGDNVVEASAARMEYSERSNGG